ncbi:hypothetical protein ACFE04_020854 [Oxalis oulophora]
MSSSLPVSCPVASIHTVTHLHRPINNPPRIVHLVFEPIQTKDSRVFESIQHKVNLQRLRQLQLQTADRIVGMKIKTDTPIAKKAREGVMDQSMIVDNHPLDCPTWDCDLQDQCMRFTSDIVEVQNLGVLGRGSGEEIGTYVERLMTSEVFENVIDIFHVDRALTSKPFAFKATNWKLKGSKTINVTDVVGSNIRIDSKGPEGKPRQHVAHFVETCNNASALAIRNAVQWANNNMTGKGIIVSDARQVIQAINGGFEDDSEIGTIYNDIRVIINLRNVFSLRWIRRQANLEAHALARSSMLYASFNVWDTVPDYVMNSY